MTTEIITTQDLQHSGEVLSQNTGWVETYRRKHDALLGQVEKCADGKLSAELDDKINSYLVSAKAALKKMEEDRKPYTQKAQEFVKLFTTLENTLGKDLYSKLQEARDRSAKIYAQEEREKQQQEQLKLAKDQERINLIAEAEGQVRTAYADILATDKGDLLEIFQGADSDTIDAVEETLKGIDTIFKIERWESIVPVITSQYGNDIDNIIVNAKAGKYDAVSAHYKKEINEYAAYLASMIPGRRKEIEAGEESAAAERLKQEQADALAKQQAEADAMANQKKEEELRQAQVDIQLDQAQRKHAAPKGRAIESYSINVKNRDGWAEIFKFYFERSEVDTDALGKVKLDSMKGWCEKYAKSNGEFISHSSIEYEEKYKAVATARAKKKVEV